MSTHSELNSQTSNSSTFTASAKAAASSADLMTKRSTTSPPYRAKSEVGGFNIASDGLGWAPLECVWGGMRQIISMAASLSLLAHRLSCRSIQGGWRNIRGEGGLVCIWRDATSWAERSVRLQSSRDGLRARNRARQRIVRPMGHATLDETWYFEA